MKRFIIIVIALFLSGCSARGPEGVRTVTRFHYQNIMVLPFTPGEQPQRDLATEIFRREMSSFSDITILADEKIDEDLIAQLGVTHPDSYGSLDFTQSPEADQRRREIREKFGVDAIVFGSFFSEGDSLYLYIQMMDTARGIVTLSFSREMTASSGKFTESLEALAKDCAQKVIEHIRENVSITSFYQY